MTAARHRLDPAHAGLVVFDMLECHRKSIEEAGVIEPVSRLIQACRQQVIPIFFVRADHRPDGADYNRSLTDTDATFRPWPEGTPQPRRFAHPPSEMRIISELDIRTTDYDVPKHRWSAFFQTSLELSLRTRGIDTLLLAGGSTHVGVASTVFAARDLDYHVIVVGDGCFGFELQRRFFLEHVFPRMARVRTVEETLVMLEAGADPDQPS
jgi:nicotinamidase-related amidase